MPEKDKKINSFFTKKTDYIREKARSIPFPGYDISLYHVISFFIKGIKQGSITTRASSIAFHIFLAMLPGTFFLISIIPYIPIHDFKEGFLSVTGQIMPKNAHILVQHIIDSLFVKRPTLPIFGFLITSFFASNAVNAVIGAFSASYHSIESRIWLQKRLISIALVFIISALFGIAIILVFSGKFLLNYLITYQILDSNLVIYFFQFGKWIIISLLILFAISFTYTYAPAKKTSVKLISIGSISASVLTILASLVFSYFMNHFAQLDKMFGTLGSLMAILLWIYFNSIAVIIGFELNASIGGAVKSEEIV